MENIYNWKIVNITNGDIVDYYGQNNRFSKKENLIFNQELFEKAKLTGEIYYSEDPTEQYFYVEGKKVSEDEFIDEVRSLKESYARSNR